jgi:hypothetical protein
LLPFSSPATFVFATITSALKHHLSRTHSVTQKVQFIPILT